MVRKVAKATKATAKLKPRAMPYPLRFRDGVREALEAHAALDRRNLHNFINLILEDYVRAHADKLKPVDPS